MHRTSLQFINIPISPDEAAMKEDGLGRCCPDWEMARKAFYQNIVSWRPLSPVLEVFTIVKDKIFQAIATRPLDRVGQNPTWIETDNLYISGLDVLCDLLQEESARNFSSARTLGGQDPHCWPHVSRTSWDIDQKLPIVSIGELGMTVKLTLGLPPFVCKIAL